MQGWTRVTTHEAIMNLRKGFQSYVHINFKHISLQSEKHAKGCQTEPIIPIYNYKLCLLSKIFNNHGTEQAHM